LSGAHRLRIEPLGLTLPVAAGQTLLEAAAAAGLQLPRSCRNGSCRACIARLTQGRAHHRIEWPGLSADEKQQGWVLPCVALADSDLVLLQPDVAQQ
jgi:ferredoxin